MRSIAFFLTKIQLYFIPEKFLNVMYAHDIKYLFVTSLEAVFNLTYINEVHITVQRSHQVKSLY
jgi:hypothetical protein